MQSKGLQKRSGNSTLISSSNVLLLLATTLFLVTACHSSESPKSDIVVNAPASGVVRSVLVGDGASVDKDAAIVEIAVPSASPQPAKDRSTTADQQATAARNDVVSAEAEANRTLAEVQRIEPLVKRGLASQAELDKARAQQQDAKERLARARERAKTAEQQRNAPQQGIGAAEEEIVAVRAPAAGRVREISVLAGQHVDAGQLLATLTSGS